MELVRVHALAFDGTVARLSFSTGEVLEIDFAERVKNRPKLRPILEVLNQGCVVDGGIAVEWPCGIDVDAQSLHGTALGMSVRWWRKRHGLSQAKAGEALGISGRMIQFYESGEQPVTKTIILAMRGYDALKSDAAD